VIFGARRRDCCASSTVSARFDENRRVCVSRWLCAGCGERISTAFCTIFVLSELRQRRSSARSTVSARFDENRRVCAGRALSAGIVERISAAFRSPAATDCYLTPPDTTWYLQPVEGNVEESSFPPLTCVFHTRLICSKHSLASLASHDQPIVRSTVPSPQRRPGGRMVNG